MPREIDSHRWGNYVWSKFTSNIPGDHALLLGCELQVRRRQTVNGRSGPLICFEIQHDHDGKWEQFMSESAEQTGEIIRQYMLGLPVRVTINALRSLV